jgi:hypothetical protein
MTIHHSATWTFRGINNRGHASINARRTTELAQFRAGPFVMANPRKC